MNQTIQILWHYLEAKRNARRWRHRGELEAWQDCKVQKHLARVLPHSRFYHELFAGKPLSDWPDFPISNKAGLMAGFDDWNTAGIRRDDALAVALKAESSRDFAPTIGGITVGLSSGTSGSRGLFLVSPAERYAWAGNLLAKILPGNLLEPHRAALCFRANSNLYRSVSSQRFKFGFFDLLEPLDTVALQLENFQPTLLVAPPALLRLLAEQKRSGHLQIQPARIFSVAEVLEPEERIFIERQFGQSLHEIYQATEGFLAATCAHGTLHLNEDLVVVHKEWLDRAQRKFTPVITDFRRTTQPILRYQLNDILTERETPCPCGSIFTGLEKIEGRCDDLLQLSSTRGNGLVPVFPDFIRRAIITGDDAINEYSVRLHSDGKMEVALDVVPEIRHHAEHSVRKNLCALCEKLGCQMPEIVFVQFVPPTLDLKRRRVQSL